MSVNRGQPKIRLRNTFVVLCYLISSSWSYAQQQRIVDASASFFACQHQDRYQFLLADDFANPVAVTELSGNPKHYKREEVYNVTVKLHEEYDSVLITGVFSAALTFQENAKQGNAYQHRMCTILHSYARRPTKRVDFLWTAPPEEMGCVDFIATLTRRDTVASKGEKIFTICPTPATANYQSENGTKFLEFGESVIIRDDFENELNPSIWKDSTFVVNGECQSLFHGRFASYCQHQDGDQRVASTVHMSTVPLNLTSAEIFQFTTGDGACNSNSDLLTNEVNMTVSYGQQSVFFDNECSSWVAITFMRLSIGKRFSEHAVTLPNTALKEGVCLRLSFDTSSGEQCVGVDNVVISSSAGRASTFHVDFDPPRVSEWYPLHGGTISNACRNSRGWALLFNSTETKTGWATTRELDLSSSSSAVEPDEILWKLDLDAVATSERWEFFNGSIENSCFTSKRHVVLHSVYDNANQASVCSPNLDLSSAGNLRFRLDSWKIHQCLNDSEQFDTNTYLPGKANLWIERTRDGQKIFLVKEYDLLKDISTFSLPIPNEGQTNEARLCFQITASTPEIFISYALDDMYILTSIPSPIDYVLQFRLNFACGFPDHTLKNLIDEQNQYHVLVQYSTDHGRQWNNLHNLCLPPVCIGVTSAIQSMWSSLDVSHPWERITLPIPYTAINNHLRIRFLQKGRISGASENSQAWALDDIHLSNCLSGCHGHGTCIETDKCSCDEGYEGPWCQFPTSSLTSVLRDNFESEESLAVNFLKSAGMELSARCGRVTSGLASVFNRAGPRQLLTFDVNSVESAVLRFGLKMNGPRKYHQHHCPGPDRPLESIYVHSSCNGGVTWLLLRVIQPLEMDAKAAELIQINLPSEAQGISCRFKIWQPYHSGAGKDVWAIDDFYLGPALSEVLARNIIIEDKAPFKDAFVGRHPFERHCNRTHVMVLQPNEMEETYPAKIESFSMLQIEVALGCNQPPGNGLNNNSVVVQYSVDGGNRWTDLLESKRHASELQTWQRIGLNLPPESWSDETRFRVMQTGRLAERNVLAVHYFYAGPNNCSELCRGNGRCTLTGCVCDEGFVQPSCVPSQPLRFVTPISDSVKINGGRFTDVDRDGCLVRGTNNILFDGPGVRFLETKEVEYASGTSIFLFLRLGDCDSRGTQTNVHIDVELSWNGGSEWSHLTEFRSPFFPKPKLVKIDVPTPQTHKETFLFKARLVQVGIQEQDRNIWSVAALTSSSASGILSSNDIISLEEPLEDNKEFWLLTNDPDPKSSCLAFDPHCLFKISVYGMLSKELKLNKGDSIQFDVSVPQLSNSNDGIEQINVEYSANGGSTWQLVRPECRSTWANCPGTFTSSRIDYRSLETSINKDIPDRFYFAVSDEMAEKPILLRWFHQNKGDRRQPIRGFQLKNLYIGPACSNLCAGHGKCVKSSCICDYGYTGDDCTNSTDSSKISGFYDTFSRNNFNSFHERPGVQWNRVVGGKIVPNFCQYGNNAVIFFGSDGPRLLQTTEMDTQNLRMVQFTLGVTTVPVYNKNCRSVIEHSYDLSNQRPESNSSFLVLDFSNDNGLTWNALETWPLTYEEEKRLGIVLPHNARTPSTILRWWQLTHPTFKAESLFWYLDDVLVNLNETNPIIFEHELEPKDEPVFPEHTSPEWVGDGITSWLGWQGLVSREEPYPVNTQLERNKRKESESPAYAETWDMEIGDPTFAQFLLMIPPETHIDDHAYVRFEYSTDMGRNWHLVEEECYHTGRYCERLHPPSRYSIGRENNATRITVHLPTRAITRSTRFRWITDNFHDQFTVPWGIGHVYVGGICPWMCSGHGTCHHGHCQCDTGYGNSDCVSIDPLPNHLIVHFDEDTELQSFILKGGGTSGGCGVLSSGIAALFHQSGLRFFESQDLDLTSGSFAQITIKFDCWAETDSFMSSPDASNHRLLVQYSVNGGITWTLIQEIIPNTDNNPQLVVVNLLRIPDLTNSTRFRLWQPTHSGEGWDTWAIDSFVVNSLIPPYKILHSNFQDINDSKEWLNWFGGKIQSFCSRDNVLVFSGHSGEQQVFTSDITLTPETILQFELNVGCDSGLTMLKTPIRLEYSFDGGKEWKLLVDDKILQQNPYQRMSIQTPTVYYASTNSQWRRESIRLSHIETTRPIRFRWTQGYLNGTEKQFTPDWGIRNIVISSRCPELCYGHGKCSSEGGCDCDDGYLGDACELTGVSNPYEFHEIFDGSNDQQSGWIRIVGGERIPSSVVGLGGTLVLNQPGVRYLETRDLDLNHANFVQFYMDSSESASTDSVLLLQYSSNGGIEWTTFYVIHLNRMPYQELYQVLIPPRAQTPATRLRWYQIGELLLDGLTSSWTIDEIYLGGEHYAKPYIEEDFSFYDKTKENWLFISGGKIQGSCHNPDPSLHFINLDSPLLAITKDIQVQPNMHLQYDISNGCDLPNSCNRIKLEYSTNFGLTWHSIPEDCLPGEDIDCQAYTLHTELLSRATGKKGLVTIRLPLTHGNVRLRWVAENQLDHDWSLHFVYVGSACGDCNGRGRCWRGSCLCPSDWTGSNCEFYLGSLLSSVRESFDHHLTENFWAKINGGAVSLICGTLDSGAALHFHEACDRFAETQDVDLRQIDVIQFHLRSDCGRGSSTHPSRILFQYSPNGGVFWYTGLTLSLQHFIEPRLVSFLVPLEARLPAVKLRLWQLSTPGQPSEDWAIDSFIFESTINASVVQKSSNFGVVDYNSEDDDFQQKFQNDEPFEEDKSKNLPNVLKLWWRKTNTGLVGEYCGKRGSIMRGKSSAIEESVLETSDFFVDSIVGNLLSFDVFVGSCNTRLEKLDYHALQLKYSLRLEISFDHGVTWDLFHSLKLRGESLNAPQPPSIFVHLGRWKSYRYSLDALSGAKFVRFRWRQAKSAFSSYWAIDRVNIGPYEATLRTTQLGLVSLMDDFKNSDQISSQWKYTSSGKVVLPTERLGDGYALSFPGQGFKWVESTELDLTFGETIQFILHFQEFNKNKRDNSSLKTVFLQCSPDEGVNWSLMGEYEPRFYEYPVLTHSIIPSSCRNIRSTFRLWQSTDLDLNSDIVRKPITWLIDNVFVENSDVFLTEINDRFRDGKLNLKFWEFYPNGVITSKICGSEDRETALSFTPVENSRFSGITSRHIAVKENYAVYFKIKTWCGKLSCRTKNDSHSGVRFEFRQGYGIPVWSLVKLSCLPSEINHLCDPRSHHSPSIYLFNSYQSWQRIILPLHPWPTSKWQFRWISQSVFREERNNWSLRDVYIGKMCPSHCNSNGDCIGGRCYCDPGFEGPSCLPLKKNEARLLPLMDHFEESPSSALWENIHGAEIRTGCGSFLPLAHGKHLHFDGCGIRMASTVSFEAKLIRRIAFVIRVGTPQQLPTCRIQPSYHKSSDATDKAVLFQYSNDGVVWRLIASHGIKNYLQPQRVMYSVPVSANVTKIRFRWWQPLHGGSTWDQWAIDNIEILA